MQAASRGLLLRNSSSTWLHKAENGRILFEGRNFSKYEITSTQRLGGDTSARSLQLKKCGRAASAW